MIFTNKQSIYIAVALSFFLSACTSTKTITQLQPEYRENFATSIAATPIYIQSASDLSNKNQPQPIAYQTLYPQLQSALQDQGYVVVQEQNNASQVLTVYLAPQAQHDDDIALHTGVALSSGGSNAFGLGISFGPNTLRPYQHYLRLVISDAIVPSKPIKTLYEVSAVAKSSCEKFSVVMPAMLRAIFSDFPGNNAQITQIKSQLDSLCN